MTTPGRYGARPAPPRPRLPQIRIVATSAQAADLVKRLAGVLNVVYQSEQVPRRHEPGRVAVHLEVRPGGPS